MIFRNHLSNSLQEESEDQEYSSSETDNSCHSFVYQSDEMTDSGIFDILIRTEPTPGQLTQSEYAPGDNIRLKDSNSPSTKHENQTVHSVSRHGQDMNEMPYHSIVNYNHNISPVEPSNTSEYLQSTSFNGGSYTTDKDDYSYNQQASPDSQQSYYLNTDGKL